MRALTRVVWSEGMHLAQHHFQAQNAYFEQLASAALGDLFFKPYGLAAIELDNEALVNGTAAVSSARGVMPDGLTFNFPLEPPPPPLEIRELFSPTREAHRLVLAIPAEVPGRANLAPEGEANGTRARFTAVVRELPDETTGVDTRTVPFARKNFRLLLEDEAVDEELVTLPIARIRRDGSGNFVYDRDYVPPCIRIDASRHLVELVSRLVDMLDTKSRALAGERQGSGTELASYGGSEIASFWLAHAVNSGIAPLRHYARIGAVHPEHLFASMAQLAGALCTFSLTASPRDLPLYDHDDPEEGFRTLDRQIRDHLDVVLPTKAVRLPVARKDAQFFSASVPDRRCLQPSAQWFLGVRSSATGGEVAGRVPKLVKVCSAKHIVRLVKEAFPGMPLEHVPSPPGQLSPRVGTQYFTIGLTDPCWRSVVDTGEVGIYVPAAIPEVAMEVLVLLQA